MKRLVSTLTLAAVLSLGTSQTFAGVIVSNGTQPTQCQETGVIVSNFAGVIVSNFAGVIVSNLTGILMGDFADTNSCYNQQTGVIVSN